MKHWIPAVLALFAFSSPALAEEALFTEGNAMNYRATMDEQNCIGMEGADWKCDSGGCCERTLKFNIQCKVLKTASFGSDKASLVVCSDDKKDGMPVNYPAVGVWYRNKAGLYHFYDVDEMLDAVDIGAKKLAEYAKMAAGKKDKKKARKAVKPNYLKIVYDMDPFIPAGITQDNEVQECDPEIEGMCTTIRIQAANAAWCRTIEMVGGDDVTEHVCIDANKAILRFEKSFSGGVYYKVVADQ